MSGRRRSSTCRLLGLILMLAGILYWGPALTAEILARLSRSPVALGESFQVIFEAHQTPDADPDFTPLERDFEILGRSQRQNIQMINGTFSKTTAWELTLMARRLGTLAVPEISFGTQRSQQLLVEVKESTPATSHSGDDLFLQVETDHQRVFQGQQILLTLRLNRAVAIENASLSAPLASDPDLVVRKLGEDKQYEKVIADRRYGVIERRYALFPQSTGDLTLEPFVFQGQVLVSGGGSRQHGSPFGLFRQPGRIRRIESPSVQIEVLPPPPEAGSTSWLPSTNLQLQDSLAGKEIDISVGNPLTRTIMLLADGLTAAQLPELVDSPPEGLKQYPDQPLLDDREDRDGIVGIRQVQVAIVPTRPGTFTLPAIQVPWWNIPEKRMEVARIPERTIQVQPAAGPPATPVQTRPGPAEPLAVNDSAPSAEPSTAGISRYLPWLTLLLGAGWLFTLGSWWMMARTHSGKRSAGERVVDRGPAGSGIRELTAACDGNDPNAAAKALLVWASWHWPASPPRSLGALSRTLGEGALSAEINALEKRLYAPQGADYWKGSRLKRLVTSFAKRDGHNAAARPGLIAPLYPE